MIPHFLLLLSLTGQSQEIIVHFFYSPDCGHCMDILLAEVPRLQNKYQFALKKYDIDFLENYRLLEEMEKDVTERGEDLPIVFVADSVFYGPEETRKKLEATIRNLSQSLTPSQRDTIKPVITTDKGKIGEINIYYFYQTGCKDCNRVEILLSNLEKYYSGIKVYRFDIFDNRNKILFEGLALRNKIPDEKRLIAPTLIIGEDYLVKDDIRLKKIDSLLKKYETGSPHYDTLNFAAAEQSIFMRFSKLTIFGVIMAGLLDGVNPCAFATLIFFVSYLLFIGRQRRDIILMAAFFILAVFITYFSIGVGAYNMLKYLSGFDIIAKIIFIGFGITALVLGALSLRDYFLARQGDLNQMILQLPLGIKRRIHKDIKEKGAVGGIIFGSLLVGFFISILEFGCTGQVYLPTITFMVSKAGIAIKPLLALFLYNVMFVLPLFIISLLAVTFSTKAIAQSLETKIPTIKFFTALLFFALGILLILAV